MIIYGNGGRPFDRCDDYDPLRSSIGVGPQGDGIDVRVVEDDPYGYYRLQFLNSNTGEVLTTTPNLDPGSRFFVCTANLQTTTMSTREFTAGSGTFSTMQALTIQDARVGDLVIYDVSRLMSDDADRYHDFLGFGVITSINNDPDAGMLITFNEVMEFDTTMNIENLSIPTSKLANGSVTSEKIANESVGWVKLADGAVHTDKLADDAVTTAKMVDGSVTSEKVAPNAITYADISITGSDRIHEENIDDNAASTRIIADGATTSAKLAESLKSSFSDYCGLSYGESLEIIANEYVDSSGRIASDNHFNRTGAFRIYKNAPVTVKATGYSTGVSMIATCSEDETNVIGRVRSIDSSEHVYSYTPQEDGYAIVSFNNTANYEIVYGTDISGIYLKNKVSTISNQIGYPDDSFPLFEGDGYIDRNGTKQSSSSFNIYGFVTLDAGDSVSATVRGYNTSVAVIFEANSNHDVFTPLVMCTDSTTRTYTYTATGKTIVGLCSHIDTPPIYNVSRTSIFEKLSNIGKSAIAPVLAFGTITCIGDSLTWSQVYTGSNASRQAYNPYPKVMEHLTGVPTSYIARPGASPASLWSDSESDIVAKDGQLTIIYLGTNNGLTDTMDTDMTGNDYTTWANTETGCYGKFIAKSLSVNSRVVLVKVHSSSGNVDTTNTVIEKMGQRFNVPVLDNTYLSGAIYHNWPNGQGSNGTHYNDFGYAQFAENIINEINSIPISKLLTMIPV